VRRFLSAFAYLRGLATRALVFLLFPVFGKGDSLRHLRSFSDYALGPIQRDEALLLYALVKTVDPKTIVEFGFFRGHSANNFLRAISSDARLFSYDISEASRKLAMKINDKRFKFIFKSQTEFEPSDVDNRLIDLVFFDAAHDFQLNVATFEKLMGSLSERALMVVHDTGAWYGDLKGLKTPQGHFTNGSASSGYIHQPGERAFVNYLKENTKDFDQIHLHSTSTFRHGLTVLQRNAGPLPL
jgi:hypothetical protein